jgi:macrolide-specific efflux system membrane fusion protein
MDALTKAKNKKPTLLARFLSLSLLKKGAIILIVLLLIWAAGIKVFGQKSTTSQYQTATAQRQSIISTVSESGNVSAMSQIDVTSPSTGIIQEVYVKNGQSVKEGQNLFKVKAVATAQEKASAYASYESAIVSNNSALQAKQAAQATLEKDRDTILTAQDALNIYKSDPAAANPTTKKSYTQNEIDDLQSQVTSAQETFTADETKYNQEDTAIAASNANLQSAQLSYQATQDSVVTAPTDGTVANLSVSQGTSVTASGNSNSSSNNSSSSNTPNSSSGNSSSGTSGSSSSSGSSTSNGSTVLVLGNFSQLSVVTQVNEVDIPKIKVGQNATVTLDAYPNQTFVGQVESVDSVGTTSSNVVTYNVYIDLVSPPTSIKPGMTASVAIQTARHDNVITVPNAAVQTANGTSFVRVLKNNQVSTVQVTTGISDDTNTEITSGISEGDIVVTGTSAATSGSSSTASPFSGGFGGGGARGGAGARGGGGGAVFFRGGGGG